MVVVKAFFFSFIFSITTVFFIACGGDSGNKNEPGVIEINITDRKSNVNFNTAKNWQFNNYEGEEQDINYDSKESHDSGTGSTYLENSGILENKNDGILSKFLIPVIAGKTYTLSFWTKTKVWPSSTIQAFGSFYDANGDYIINSNGSRCSNSKKDEWEQSFVKITVPNNSKIKYFAIRAVMNLNDISTKVWIDDFKLTEGINLPARSQKNAFDGSKTSVDTLGNIKIDGADFFPIGIYADRDRDDWSIYANQGFNVNMWSSNTQELQKASDAGLKSAMQIVQYMIGDKSWIPGNDEAKLVALGTTMDAMLASPNIDDLLFYYIDNEFYHLKPIVSEVANLVKSKDESRPIYMLNGDYALPRKYNDVVDLTGAYVAYDGFDKQSITKLIIMDNTPNQKLPVSFAQINAGVGLNFRPILFGAIAKGARAMAYWRDGGEKAGDITTKLWWNDLPKIKEEINLMMPLIKADHNPILKAQADNENIISGTRVVDGVGYIILANPTDANITVTFSIVGNSSDITGVVDYFSTENVGTFTAGSVRVDISKHGSKVVKLIY